VLKRDDLVDALHVLEKALEVYPGRVEEMVGEMKEK
jgi:hypothetical protein